MIRFGLIGKSLQHSFSKQYFTKKWAELGLSETYRYDNFELQSLNELDALIRNEKNLRGFNVTIPYKTEILAYCDDWSPEVEAIGACNTILVQRTGKDYRLRAFNTDVIGFDSYFDYLPLSISKAIIFGSGGASKAVQWVLKQRHISFQVVSRLKLSDNTLTYEELTNKHFREYPLLIQTTPVGMFPKLYETLPIPYDELDENNLLIDLIYNPAETLFLSKGRERGAKTWNGQPMLIRQAEAAWSIFQLEDSNF